VSPGRVDDLVRLDDVRRRDLGARRAAGLRRATRTSSTPMRSTWRSLCCLGGARTPLDRHPRGVRVTPL